MKIASFRAEGQHADEHRQLVATNVSLHESPFRFRVSTVSGEIVLLNIRLELWRIFHDNGARLDRVLVATLPGDYLPFRK